MVLPSHSRPWYSSGISYPNPQIITIFYEYHHPKLFHDWCGDGLPSMGIKKKFFLYFAGNCVGTPWSFLNSVRNKSWRKWYSWSTWTLSSIHIHSLDNLISWPKKIWFCLCQFELSFCHWQLNEFLVNMNSQEWLIVKDPMVFPNIQAQLIPTHTISTCVSSLIDRNEEEL